MFNKTFEALLEMRRAEISAVTGIAEAQGWRPTMEDAAVVDAAAVARRPGGENPLVLAVLWPLHGGRHKYADAAKNISKTEFGSSRRRVRRSSPSSTATEARRAGVARL